MLEAEGELVRVAQPVSTVLEMTEICTRLVAQGGPAVLFEHPVRADGETSDIPCLANLFGSVKRIAMAVTMDGKVRTTAKDLRGVGELLAFMRNPQAPRDVKEAFDMLPLRPYGGGHEIQDRQARARAGSGAHRRGHRSGAPADPDLLAERAGSPDHLAAGGERLGPSKAREDDFNLGVYRMQVIGRDRTIMRWLAHRPGGPAPSSLEKEDPKDNPRRSPPAR